jgi:predicted TIM-barrel fold metal-dependent hydrolase
VTQIATGAVDCDVHVEPASIETLHPFLSSYWLEYLRGSRLQLGSVYPPSIPTSARPEAREAGTFPPRDFAALKAQVLDRYQPEVVILNSVSMFISGYNPYYQATLATALNEWLRDEFLSADDRLRASIVVPTLNPEAAAAEIDRVGDDRRFAQVILPIRTETPWGNLRWRPIHEAAARHDLPIAFHAWGPIGRAPTTTGYTRTYYEDYVANGQLVAPPQLLSLIAEGVFERHPDLRVCLAECGFNWIPSLMWQFDKDWRSLWREVPWLKARPSEYLQRHLRATTAPTHFPSWVTPTEIERLCRMLGAADFLMYASDYPHDHGEDGLATLLEVLGPEGAEAVLRGNARSFYRLAA